MSVKRVRRPDGAVVTVIPVGEEWLTGDRSTVIQGVRHCVGVAASVRRFRWRGWRAVASAQLNHAAFLRAQLTAGNFGKAYLLGE